MKKSHIVGGVLVLAGIAVLVGLFLVAYGFRTPAPKPEIVGKAVQHIHAADFDAKVLQSKVPVLVDFYAEWCPPCKRLAPVLEELAKNTPDVKIFKVNVDENEDLSNNYQIQLLPCLIVFHNGQVVGRRLGYADQETLKQFLANPKEATR